MWCGTRALPKKGFAPRIGFTALSLIASGGSGAGQSSGALGPAAFNFSKGSMNNLLAIVRLVHLVQRRFAQYAGSSRA